MSNQVSPVNFSGFYCHPQNSPFFIRRASEAFYNNLNSSNPTLSNVGLGRIRNNQDFKLPSFTWNPLGKLRDSLIFAPSKEFSNLINEEGINHESVFIDTPDGEKLHGYFLPAKEKTDKVMLYLHGNDENVSRWFLGPVHIQERLNINALIVDYRGYGKSTGKPTSEGVIVDALAMYQYLLDKGYKPENISVYGRSLGGAIALELASRVKIRSVVFQSSFTSLKELLKYHLPYLPSFLIKNDLFNSRELIRKINVPVLISHGSSDKIVPLNHAYSMYELANDPKKLIILNGAGHEHLKDFYTEEYFEILRRFFL